MNRKRTHTHTGGSDDFVKEYKNIRLGTNPEINKKLDELTQKINLIEYRQMKMQTDSKSHLKEEEFFKNPQTRVVSKSAGTRMNEIVFKELKTVKNDIH